MYGVLETPVNYVGNNRDLCVRLKCLKESIIYSIHLKGKVNDYLMMRQYSCGILPTFLSLEAHQGKIISYVTAI